MRIKSVITIHKKNAFTVLVLLQWVQCLGYIGQSMQLKCAHKGAPPRYFMKHNSINLDQWKTVGGKVSGVGMVNILSSKGFVEL